MMIKTGDSSGLLGLITRPLSQLRVRKYFRFAVTIGIVLVLGLIFAVIDLAPDLSHMRITVLSGPQNGRDYALVSRLAEQAQRRHGQVVNVATGGDVDNLQRLVDANGRETLFAVVLDGLQYPSPDKLELAARLPKPATIYVLGPDADKIHHLGDLMGLRIGIGPRDSGTALFVREVFKARRIAEIKPALSEHSFDEQVELLKTGALDLGVFIMDEDAPLIEQAVLDGLQILDFDNAEVLPMQIPAVKVTTLYSGHFDPLKPLPPDNKKIFQVDRLILTNQDASRSEVAALLVLLNTTFKGFIDYNRITPNETGLQEARPLENFIQNNGPSLIDQYAPWLVDLMPPANILHYVVVVSLLFNATIVWHNFRLWRIDARRLKIEKLALRLFGEETTIAEIERLEPKAGQFSAEDKALIDDIIRQVQELRRWARRLSLSLVAPMGSEMLYRNQENLIYQKLLVLHRFRDRLNALGRN